MSEQFIGEIRLFPYGTLVPRDWKECNGETLAIAENEALFALLGNTYGGNGTTEFKLPDLQGRVPLGVNSPTYVLGAEHGSENVTLTSTQIPTHTHAFNIDTPPGSGGTGTPGGTVVPTQEVSSSLVTFVADSSTKVNMAATSLANYGGNGSGTANAHENRQPYLALRYYIATRGIFPSAT